MNRYQWAVTLLCCGVIIIHSSLTLAQAKNDQQPESDRNQTITEAIDDAIALFQTGDYENSVVKFKEAYRFLDDANILFNIARCYHIMGDWKEAREYYNRFIYHPDVDEKSKQRARRYLSDMESESKQKEATDTESVASTDSDRTGADESESGNQENALSDSAEANAESIGTEDVSQERPTRRPGVLEWTLWGSGAALMIAGGIVGALTIGNHKDFESATTLSSKKDLDKKGKTLALTSDICLGTGILVVASGIVLWVVKNKRQDSSQEKAAFIPSATPDGASLSWILKF